MGWSLSKKKELKKIKFKERRHYFNSSLWWYNKNKTDKIDEVEKYSYRIPTPLIFSIKDKAKQLFKNVTIFFYYIIKLRHPIKDWIWGGFIKRMEDVLGLDIAKHCEKKKRKKVSKAKNTMDYLRDTSYRERAEKYKRLNWVKKEVEENNVKSGNEKKKMFQPWDFWYFKMELKWVELKRSDVKLNEITEDDWLEIERKIKLEDENMALQKADEKL